MEHECTLMDEIGELYRSQGRPYSALLELTYKCNLKCFHCFNTHQNKRELTTEEIMDSLYQLADLGVMHLTLSGGEIYCRPDFQLIATTAKQLGFALNIFTNATMLTKEKVTFLKNLGVLEVGISILSVHDEIHDAITKQPGSLKNTLEGLKLLTDQEVRVKVRCLIIKSNLKDYGKVRELALNYGATCQFDTTLMPGGGNDQTILDQRLSKEELVQVFSDPNVHYISENPLAYDGTHQMDVKENFTDFQLMCGAGITYLSLNPYGEVFSCVQQLKPAGNLFEKPLKEIWETAPTFLKARGVTFDSLHACSGCQNNSICGRCPALAEKEDGDFFGPSSIACQTSDALRMVYESKLEPAPKR